LRSCGPGTNSRGWYCQCPLNPRLPFVKAHFALRLLVFSCTYVLAGFTVNECRLLLKLHTLDAVLILIPSPPARVKTKVPCFYRGTSSDSTQTRRVRTLRATIGYSTMAGAGNQQRSANGEFGRLNGDNALLCGAYGALDHGYLPPVNRSAKSGTRLSSGPPMGWSEAEFCHRKY